MCQLTAPSTPRKKSKKSLASSKVPGSSNRIALPENGSYPGLQHSYDDDDVSAISTSANAKLITVPENESNSEPQSYHDGDDVGSLSASARLLSIPENESHSGPQHNHADDGGVALPLPTKAIITSRPNEKQEYDLDRGPPILTRQDSTRSLAKIAAAAEAFSNSRRKEEVREKKVREFVQRMTQRIEPQEVKNARFAADACCEEASTKMACSVSESIASIWAKAAAGVEETARLRRLHKEKPKAGRVAAIAVGASVRFFDRSVGKWMDAVVMTPYDAASRTYKLDKVSYAPVELVRRNDLIHVPLPSGAPEVKAIFDKCGPDQSRQIHFKALAELAKKDASIAQALSVDTGDEAEWAKCVESLFAGVTVESAKQLFGWEEFFIWQLRLAQPQPELKAIFETCDTEKTGCMKMGEFSLLVRKDITVAEFLGLRVEDDILYKDDLALLLLELGDDQEQTMSWAHFRIWKARWESARLRGVFGARALERGWSKNPAGGGWNTQKTVSLDGPIEARVVLEK